VDLIDNIDPEVIVAVEGRHGIVDWLGFHPSPDPSFEEEVKRDPVAAMSNRLARAKKLEAGGCIKKAQQLREEAEKIKQIIFAKEKAPSKKGPKAKLRFVH